MILKASPLGIYIGGKRRNLHISIAAILDE